MKKPSAITVALLLAALWLTFGQTGGCTLPTPFTPKVTAATYVYEKGDTPIPSPVLAAIDKLNRLGILATTFEQDTKDGTGDVPEQYKAARTAAMNVGLPALVVVAGEKVLRTVKEPKTEEAVLEAVK